MRQLSPQAKALARSFDYVDIETDGFNPSVIWCASVCRDNEVKHYLDADSFNGYLRETDRIIVFHNGHKFDIPILQRLWGSDFSGKPVLDTLVLSMLANPSRDGGHSLRAWGERLGFPKGEHEDWSQLSPQMLDYCAQDTRVTAALHYALQKELAHTGQQAIDLEHRVAYIIGEQERNGWEFDLPHACMLLAEISEKVYDLETTLVQSCGLLTKPGKKVTPKYKKDGSLSVVGVRDIIESGASVSGEFSRIHTCSLNPNSRVQLGDWLIRKGWKPTALTPTGKPVIDEGSMAKCPIPEAKLIHQYFLLNKKKAMVAKWIEEVSDSGRIHGRVRTIGAVTGRMTHSDPNLAQVPSVRSEYGRECRECFTVPEGKVLVGTDASSLELVCLAHYMGDDNYSKEVESGNAHTINQEAAGLDTRDQAKTFIYAFLYGAGDEKIGTIVGGGAAEGARLKQRFLSRTPSLRKLRQRVDSAARRGWLMGLDGRQIHVRSAHAALNSLLQSAGAVIMKQALVLLYDEVKLRGLNAIPVGNIHDEYQWEVAENDAEEFAKPSVRAIEEAGVVLGLRCNVTGEAKIGRNWADTH